MNNLFFRRERTEKKDQSPLRLLLPSLLGFALCIVCLAATTWAWFMVSVTSGSNTIQAATFDVNVAVFDSIGDPVPANTDGSYTVLAGGSYTVALQKWGNAEKVYILIKDGDTEYYTGNLAGGDVQYLFDRTFTSTNVTITPKWGEAPNVDQDKRIEIGPAFALLNELPVEEEASADEDLADEEDPTDEPADDAETPGEGDDNTTDSGDDSDTTDGSDTTDAEPAAGDGAGADDDTDTGDKNPTDTNGDGETGVTPTQGENADQTGGDTTTDNSSNTEGATGESAGETTEEASSDPALTE